MCEDCLKQKISMPVMNQSWLRKFLCATSIKKGKHSLPDDVEIKKTYDDLYVQFIPSGKTAIEHFASRDKLSVCIDYAAVEMLTAITNNIKVQKCQTTK